MVGPLKIIWLQTPTMGRDPFYQVAQGPIPGLEHIQECDIHSFMCNPSATNECNPQAMRKVVSSWTSKSRENKTIHSHLPISWKRGKWHRKVKRSCLARENFPSGVPLKKHFDTLDCWTIAQVLLALLRKDISIFLCYLLVVTNLTYVSQLGHVKYFTAVIGVSAAVKLGNLDILWAAAWKSLKNTITSQ